MDGLLGWVNGLGGNANMRPDDGPVFPLVYLPDALDQVIGLFYLPVMGAVLGKVFQFDKFADELVHLQAAQPHGNADHLRASLADFVDHFWDRPCGMTTSP